MNQIWLSILLITPAIVFASNYPAIPGPWGEKINFAYLEVSATDNTSDIEKTVPKIDSENKKIIVNDLTTNDKPEIQAKNSPVTPLANNSKIEVIQAPQTNTIENLKTPRIINNKTNDKKTDVSEIATKTTNPPSLPTSEELEQALPAVMSSKVIPAKISHQDQSNKPIDADKSPKQTLKIAVPIKQAAVNSLAEQPYTENYSDQNNRTAYPLQQKPQYDAGYPQVIPQQQIYSRYPSYQQANRYNQAYSPYQSRQWQQKEYLQPSFPGKAGSQVRPLKPQANTESLYQSFDEQQNYPQYIPSQSIH